MTYKKTKNFDKSMVQLFVLIDYAAANVKPFIKKSFCLNSKAYINR